MVIRPGIVLVIVALTAACADHSPPKKPLTERQHDSVIGASKLPGAAGVRGALRLLDSGDARNARYDSISRTP